MPSARDVHDATNPRPIIAMTSITPVAPPVRGEEFGQGRIVDQARQPPPGPPGNGAGHQRDQSEQYVGVSQACKHEWRQTGVQESASCVPARRASHTSSPNPLGVLQLSDVPARAGPARPGQERELRLRNGWA